MPPLTRWFIKSSLVFFVAALITGLAQSARSVIEVPELFGALGPVYFHLFLVGWISQLIFGVVFWMFPKYSMERPRGSETLGWVTFGCINLGLVLRAISEPLVAQGASGVWGWLLGLSALLQWVGGMAFVTNTWPRVKEK